ncbi:restriction endonuclease subunit S [[Mycoplasma] anseris]|uniref:Restriction endonuclease subunit S n=1 Tax=[Mycoplasma] anseris TaxID=92400 RepID=A0A2Z4NDL2_9BACT|nr:restriction endonuclease subunit S [[Mycoplasma] anseris]
MYHYLLMNQNNIYLLAKGSGAPPNLSNKNIDNIEIPIPSLNIQNQIVKILDKFSELVEDTKGLLPKEIEQRQKQYEYYREKLLSFGNENNIGREREREREVSNDFFLILQEAMHILGLQLSFGLEYKKLGEICEIKTGDQLNKNKMIIDGKYPVINGGVLASGLTNNWNCEENTITVSQGGASAGFVNFITEKFWLGAHAYKIKIKNNSNPIINRYIFHFLKMNQENFQENKVGAGIPSISRNLLNEIKIPIPSLRIQQNIVKTLDQFQELIENTNGLLPKEIEQRQKQYEYWRQKLFDFKK